MADTNSDRDYRIGEGGLLRRFEVVAHLTSLRGQLLALLAVTWLPMVALGFASDRPEALLYDLSTHVRLLVVAPLLLFLDHLFPRLCRYTLGQLLEQAFVPSAAEPPWPIRVEPMAGLVAQVIAPSVQEVSATG